MAKSLSTLQRRSRSRGIWIVRNHKILLELYNSMFEYSSINVLNRDIYNAIVTIKYRKKGTEG